MKDNKFYKALRSKIGVKEKHRNCHFRIVFD